MLVSNQRTGLEGCRKNNLRSYQDEEIIHCGHAIKQQKWPKKKQQIDKRDKKPRAMAILVCAIALGVLHR
jgi:hypothetical protein